jgi:hypothetical protein
MQSPKSPVYKAGYRSTRSSVVTPSALVPCMVSVAELPELDIVDVAVLCAWTEGIIVVRRAREETNAVVHDAGDKGKRAIVEMVELVYVEQRRRNRATPFWCYLDTSAHAGGSKYLELFGGRVVT